MGMDGLDPVVAGRPAPELELHPSAGKIEFVVHDDNLGEVFDSVAPHEQSSRLLKDVKLTAAERSCALAPAT